jgi:hypothetical protein
MKIQKSFECYLKSPYKSIKHSTYFDIYDNLFSRYCGEEITFVEIGVLDGGSLFMWREFLGPKARIIGVDLNPNARKWIDDGFEIFIGSQSDELFWEGFIEKVGMVDVVLDDGGHTYEQQIITTEMLLDNIKDSGMLVVEDVHTSYMSGFGAKKFSFVNYVKNYLDKINLRFGAIDNDSSDKRVWSIQSFESIVAFHINRKYSIISKPTTNSGKSNNARDYRFVDNASVNFLNNLSNKFTFLIKIPGVKYFGLLISRYLVYRKSKSNLNRFF